MSAPPVISLLTDFGPGSVYVGQMHGTLLRRSNGSVRVVDLFHRCPFAHTEAAAYVLRRSYRHFPAGTVHVAVVDPGVGSERDILAAERDGHFFLAPDNGLLADVFVDAPPARVHRVTNRDLMNDTVSHTFHGRDIFAPVAVHLATGGAIEDTGPAVALAAGTTQPAIEDGHIEGRILIVDHFGNLITNIPRELALELGDPATLRVRIGAAFIDRMVETFSDVERGIALTYFGSGNHLEIAVNGGRASDVLGLGVGSSVGVERRAL